MKYIYFFLFLPLFLLASEYDFSLSQLHEKYYEKAFTLYKQGEAESAFEEILKIGDFKQRPECRLLYLKIIYDLKRYKESVALINESSKEFIEQNLTDFFYFYFQSCRKSGDESSLSNFSEEYAYLFQKKGNINLRKILADLFTDGGYEITAEIIDIFPERVFTESEYALIVGAAEFYLKNYRKAKELLKFSCLNASNETGKTALEYLTAVNFYLGELPEFPDTFKFYNDKSKINLLVNYLKNDKLDYADKVAEELENNEYYYPLKALINLKRNQIKTALKHINKADTAVIKNHGCLLDVAAEINYKNKKYRNALAYYKLYAKSENADKNYANYAAAYSFNGFYRYNNTAYYWLKNLDEKHSFYDSLALKDLALLYNFTEHYRISAKYYRQFFKKYSGKNLSPEFCLNRLLTLFKLKYFDSMLPVLKEYSYLADDETLKKYLFALGNYNYSKGNFTVASELYADYLKLTNDPDISFRLERINYTLGKYEDTEDYLLAFTGKNYDSERGRKTGLDLIKYYIGKNDTENAEKLIDILARGKSETDDTLSFWRGKIQTLRGNEEQAVALYGKVISSSRDSVMVKDALNALRLLLEDKSPRQYSRVISSVIDSMSYRRSYNDILLTLADLYETSELYGQANEVYFNMLADSSFSDSTAIMNKIGVNLMYRGKFEEADTLLNRFVIERGKNPETMLLIAAADMGKNKISRAVNVLLDIYFSFPEYSKREEVILILADNLYGNGQFLPALYFYRKLNFENDPQTDFIVKTKISELTKIVDRESELFKFPLSFENSLKTMAEILEKNETDN
ncbi:MAG: hypothetical protein CSB55_02760 [Candidatus Cloacimonadota bacterium]|nr:MAG: hypothetical protein CSB55_02760 [Candidatus Cloacimonadota bacterium]